MFGPFGSNLLLGFILGLPVDEGKLDSKIQSHQKAEIMLRLCASSCFLERIRFLCSFICDDTRTLNCSVLLLLFFLGWILITTVLLRSKINRNECVTSCWIWRETLSIFVSPLISNPFRFCAGSCHVTARWECFSGHLLIVSENWSE